VGKEEKEGGKRREKEGQGGRRKLRFFEYCTKQMQLNEPCYRLCSPNYTRGYRPGDKAPR